MPETEPVRQVAYETSYVCDGCGEGHMFATGGMTLASPPTYLNKCNTCGYTAYLRHRYPIREFRSEEARTC